MIMRILIAGLALLAAAQLQAQDGDPAAGKAKSATCAGCHGADGNSVNPLWPKLAGQHAQYLAKQLADFKAGERQDPTMSPMAAPLDAQAIKDLSAYYAQQEIKLGAADPALVAQGEKLYRAGNPNTGVAACMSCHGPSGMGNPPANFPRVSGQHAEYVAKTLRDFKTGARSNDAGQMMRNIAAKMTEEEIKAVASYIAGLH